MLLLFLTWDVKSLNHRFWNPVALKCSDIINNNNNDDDDAKESVVVARIENTLQSGNTCY